MYSLTYLQLLAFLSWIIKEHLRMLIFLKMCRDHIFFEQTISFPFVISGPVLWCYPGGCCNVFEGAYYQQCNHENYRFWCVSNFLWCSCDQFISHFLSFFFFFWVNVYMIYKNLPSVVWDLYWPWKFDHVLMS